MRGILGMPIFAPFDKVRSKRDMSRTGFILEYGPVHAGEQWYRVGWSDGDASMTAEADLVAFVGGQKPQESLGGGHLAGYREFQRLITFHRLRQDPPLSNSFAAFNASRTRFMAYQFKPLLKFLDSPQHRLLIADEVGLGKTIEAGLILTELRARQLVQRVLVVCPATLTEKWRQELRNRFDEKFTILRTNDFLQILSDYEDHPEQSEFCCILSLESIRQDSVLERLESLNPNLDLVIVDEAHHMRNFGRKQRKAGVLLSGCASAMLLLTATPVQLGTENLFSLLNILDEEDFRDLAITDMRFRENEPIVMMQNCMARIPPQPKDALNYLERARHSSWVSTNPYFKSVQDRMERLARYDDSGQLQLRDLVEIQRDLARLNLIGDIYTRTRKRSVRAGLPTRRAHHIELVFTPGEWAFYNAVTDFVRAIAVTKTDLPIIQQWMINMPQRRMASSIQAMVEYYRENLGLNELDMPEDFPFFEEDEQPTITEDASIETARQRLHKVIASLPLDFPDSKFQKLLDVLKSIRSEHPQGKAMVFAFFKDTLDYLAMKLGKEGFDVSTITGDVLPEKRSEIVSRFRAQSSMFQI